MAASASAASLSMRRAASSRRAPSAAKARAVAAPMPDEAPVTKTIFPLRVMVFIGIKYPLVQRVPDLAKKGSKKCVFGVESALFGAKKGQNRGFTVTDSLTGLFIMLVG